MIRRSKIQIYYDILRVIQRETEARPTHVLYKANLSYERSKKYLDQLIEEGFIGKIEKKGSMRYILTEKGHKFISEFIKVREFSEAFGLDV